MLSGFGERGLKGNASKEVPRQTASKGRQQKQPKVKGRGGIKQRKNFLCTTTFREDSGKRAHLKAAEQKENQKSLSRT